MAEQMNPIESLSAALDGEASPGEYSIFDDLSSNLEMRDAWLRYHLVGEVLKSNGPALGNRAFAQRVKTQIDAEPAILAPRNLSRKVLKPVAGFAIAASVAALAVIGVQSMLPQADGTVQTVALETQSPTAGVGSAQLVASARSTDDPIEATTATTELMPVTPDYQRRINSYLVNFNEQRTNVGVPSVHPYVRIVGFETE